MRPSPSAALTSPTPSAATHDRPPCSYKGKLIRSWDQLPPELLRYIGTLVLLDVSTHGHCPRSWELREHWQHRMVWTALRDASELERIMAVCPAWTKALSTHLYWQNALNIVDPNDRLAHLALPRLTAPSSAVGIDAGDNDEGRDRNASATARHGQQQPPLTRLSPYHHFRTITRHSCLVCRINAPYADTAFAQVKRTVHVPTLGPVSVCREHRRNEFCGVCLRSGGPPETEYAELIGCSGNEDEDTWPRVEATCTSCRRESLCSLVEQHPALREAVGGPKLASPDWETRQTVDAFVFYGEGTIQELLQVASEKQWLRRHTRLPDLLAQALLASRLAAREENGYASDEELSEDDEEAEVAQLTEEAGGMRQMALDDWARTRILDGHWISPADQWYRHAEIGNKCNARAEHPAPWSVEEDADEPHPRPATTDVETPPSYALCEQAFRCSVRQVRAVLLPAMNNLVRKLVIECTSDGVDPAVKAARMPIQEVIAELRHEEIWFNGIDWSQRRENRRQERERRAKEEDESSSASSKSGDSDTTTSPVLSTSTLQTTPSPPPSDAKQLEEDTPSSPAFPIPILPVLERPVLLHPIPYIPVSLSHLPNYSMDALKNAWREACAPLYHCKCRICERAVQSANIAAGTLVPTQVQAAQQTQSLNKSNPPVIQLEKAIQVEDGEQEEEQELQLIQDNPEAREFLRQERQEEEGDEVPLLPRKRGSKELDITDDIAVEDTSDVRGRRSRGPTPPKRVRLEESLGPAIELSPRRKRSSEEVEDEPTTTDAQCGQRDGKRIKTGFVASEPADVPRDSSADSRASPPPASTPTRDSDGEDVELVPAVQTDKAGAVTPKDVTDGTARLPRSMAFASPGPGHDLEPGTRIAALALSEDAKRPRLVSGALDAQR